jgi:putative endonuclease
MLIQPSQTHHLLNATLIHVIPTAGRNLLLARDKRYFVYILASTSRVLYVGVTGFLMARILQHKSGEVGGFTCRYKVDRLAYYEVFRYVNNAIARETEIKKWRREKKVALIKRDNPTWEDLAADWGERIVLKKADSSLRSE